MKNNPNNPPAFPTDKTEFVEWTSGMTLLDWFAGKAMQGYVSYWGNITRERIEKCYQTAHAMLEERTKHIK